MIHFLLVVARVLVLLFFVTLFTFLAIGLGLDQHNNPLSVLWRSFVTLKDTKLKDDIPISNGFAAFSLDNFRAWSCLPCRLPQALYVYASFCALMCSLLCLCIHDKRFALPSLTRILDTFCFTLCRSMLRVFFCSLLLSLPSFSPVFRRVPPVFTSCLSSGDMIGSCGSTTSVVAKHLCVLVHTMCLRV